MIVSYKEVHDDRNRESSARPGEVEVRGDRTARKLVLRTVSVWLRTERGRHGASTRVQPERSEEGARGLESGPWLRQPDLSREAEGRRGRRGSGQRSWLRCVSGRGRGGS